MIWTYKEGRLCEAESLLEALEITGEIQSDSDRTYVVSAVGAGGKTTMLHRLADEYTRAGQRVVVTTTTHIIDEEKEYFLSDPSPEKIQEQLDKYWQVWAGLPAPGRKLQALPGPVFEELLTWRIPILVEADGARRMPLKAPAGHEPVIPGQTTHVLSVYGLDAVGRELSEVCFRSGLAEHLLDKKPTDVVTVSDIAFLASSEQGGRKGCPQDAVYTVVLNKADTPARREDALRICEELEKRGIRHVIVTFSE